MEPRQLRRRLVEARLEEALADSPVVLIHGPRQVRPEGVLAYFRTCLKKRAQRDVVPAGVAGGGAVRVAEDPYA